MAQQRKRAILWRDRKGRYFRERRQHFVGIVLLLLSILVLGYEMLAGSREEIRYVCRWLLLVILLAVGVLGGLKYLVNHLKCLLHCNDSLSKIDTMTGEQFESYLVAKFTALGYRTQRIGGAYDYGADLLISKGKKTTVVQAKRYKSKVGIAAVQQVVAARVYYKADAAMVVTNSHFTSAAKELAAANQVELWDRERL